MKTKVLSVLRPATVLVLTACVAGAAKPDDPSVSPMRAVIERYAADRSSIARHHTVDVSPGYREQMRRFYEQRKRELEAVDFDALGPAGRIDYLLLRSDAAYRPKQLRHEQEEMDQVAALVPFAPAIIALEEKRLAAPEVDPEASARAVSDVARQVTSAREALEQKLKAGEAGKKELPGAVLASRAAKTVAELRETLKRWHGFYSGFHPEFTWWVREPYPKADKALEDYASFLRKKLAGFPDKDGEDEPVVGDPIGRQALLDALEAEFIAYSPEELIEIAEKEFAFCQAEMKRAADDLGCSGDWKKALDLVSNKHVKPGEQPKLIKELAEEATRYVESNELVTVPELCKQTWRIEMMPPERQKVNPYFTGGAVISVSFPTDAMSFEDKLMSLRGNNPSFCRATVHHELIPGHHLQIFMGDRFNTHRKQFRTPFLVEGWPLYWELLLWDRGFARNAEDRVGMLFWRAHRCARIIFSLKFHLGQMTAQEAIDLLVDRVGHERRNATAEVRRSVAGDYGPLYQAAYLLGGMQIKAMRRELVESKKMTDRQFHDAILRENAIPVALIRASLTGEKLTREWKSDWRFYTDNAPAKAKAQAAVEGVQKSDAVPVAAAVGRPRVYRDKVDPHWLPGNKQFWYRNDLRGGGTEYVLVDAEKGTRTPGFDPKTAGVAEADPSGTLPASRTVRPSREGRGETEVTFVNQTDKEVHLFWSDPEGNRQPYGSIEPGARRAQHTFAGHVWVAAGRDGEVLAVFEAADRPARAVIDGKAPVADVRAAARQLVETVQRRRERRWRNRSGSPDGKWEAFVRDDNLWVREVGAGREVPLSTDAGGGETYSRDDSRDRAAGGGADARSDVPAVAPEVYWSPDSRKLVAVRTRRAPGHTIHLIESSPKDQVQPKLHSLQYLKPGDEIPVQKPRLFDAENRKEIPIRDELFPNPWSVGEFRWDRDSSRFTFLYNQRGHQVLRVVAVDATSGDARPVVDETSETFVDYSGKKFSEYLDETGEIVWMSERDGWNHLYLYDSGAGQVKNQITKGEWVVRAVDRVDKDKRQVWFQAGGIRSGQDPYHVHHCRVNLDGTGLVVLTEGDGNHAVQFSPDRRFFIDTWSRVDLPPRSELRRSDDGSLVCKLEEADASDFASAGQSFPERFVAKGRDGSTDIHGIIIRPRSFDPSRRYPVIESIYAGPQSAHVPKSFRPASRQQELADRGFIVVQIDGMGTGKRSKKFHDVCWKNLADAGFPDRIPWIKAAAAKYPQMDLGRVGIYGGSAGGQNALGALLLHGDFYKAAVADCGCHDNRMDKIWWNEQWMGWPVGPHYAGQSNVTLAPNLQGKLLLIVGELDRNVDPASTMQVVNALVKADKDFDLLVVPGAGHGAGSSRYGWRRTTDFFARHLLGDVKPSGTETAARAGI